MCPILNKFVLWAQTQVKAKLKSTLMAEDMAPFVQMDGTTGYVGIYFFSESSNVTHDTIDFLIIFYGFNRVSKF